MAQVGTATLSNEGIHYHTYINGFTEGMPEDIVAINPYTQLFERNTDGTLSLQCNTELVCTNGEIIRSRIVGHFTFNNMHLIAKNFGVKYEPKFKVAKNRIDLEMPVSIFSM